MAMGMGMSWVAALMMAFTQGAGNDLLDYVDAKAYWRAERVEMTLEAMSAQLADVGSPAEVAKLIRNLGAEAWKDRDAATRKLKAMGPSIIPEVSKATKSDDVEVRGRAEDILKTLKAAAETSATRRLMAIRALGELKKREALPLLRRQLKHPEFFVREYAAEAIAAIEGKPFKRADATDAELAADLAVLPPGCAIVAQLRIPPGAPVSYAKIIKMLRQGGQKVDERETMDGLTRMLMGGVSLVGNVRAQAVTVGVSGDMGGRTGFVVFAVRGRCDAAAAKRLLRKESRRSEKIAGIEVFQEREIALMCPSDSRFVGVAGPRQAERPVAAVAEALVPGKPPVKQDPVIAGLLKSIDRTKSLWAVAKMTKNYRQVPFFAPFDTITLVGDAGPDGTRFTLVARGKDAAKIAAAIVEFDALMKEGIEELTRVAERMPPMKIMLELLKSIKTNNQGAQVTVTAELKGSVMSIMGMFLGARTVGGGRPIEARPVPVRPDFK